MRNIVSDIRKSVPASQTGACVFYHGRKADAFYHSIQESTEDCFVYLEPITFSRIGDIADNLEQASFSISFVTQDTPDSEHDAEMNESDELSMEEKQFNMKLNANNWLVYFNDNYSYYKIATATVAPIFRAGNVCTGVTVNVTITYNLGC